MAALASGGLGGGNHFGLEVGSESHPLDVQEDKNMLQCLVIFCDEVNVETGCT